MFKTPDRNLAMELVRVTEAAALGAGRYVGRGDKNGADAAAVDAMRLMLSTVPMDGIIVIGEGEKDEAPMLFNGEKVGNGQEPFVDVAVDPIDGTTLTSKGMGNALAVVAVAERGTMFNPGPIVYMDKLAVGAAARDAVDIDAPIEDNVKKVAKAHGIKVEEVVVTILERPRHETLIKAVRATGARVFLISDGDVAGAINAATPDSGIHMLVGIGGTPEGVVSACALKCLGGQILGKSYPRDEAERQAALDLGFDLDQTLAIDDLVSSDNVFFAATGITDGRMLRGVRYHETHAYTHSMVMRSLSGTIRWVEADHQLSKLATVAGDRYDA